MNKPFLVIQHVESEDAGAFARVLKRRGVETETVRTFESRRVPGDASGLSGLLVMGGPMNVEDAGKYPNLADEMRLIRGCHLEGVPVLGICLGAQLLAAAFSAPVYQGKVREIGWFDVSLTGQGLKDALFEGFPRAFKVLQWHSQTFDLPAGAVRLAGSRNYPNQAFRMGDRTWGLQFHLEATERHVGLWCDQGAAELEGLPRIDRAALLEDTQKHESAAVGLAECFFELFLGLVSG